MTNGSSADHSRVFGGFSLHHVPCSECGAPIAKSELDEHVCERERWLDYQVGRQREELDGLEDEYRAFLDSPAGRFALWYAARHRGRPASG